MDLSTLTALRQPASRAELALAPGEAFLGGGSWLFSEPQVHLTGLVDLTALGWPATERAADGLSISATCTFAQLAALPRRPAWRAQPLLRQCCTALLGSFKVWNVATVGGNICLALAAGPMTSLAVALDATMVVWTPDGPERRVRAVDFVTGVQSTVLRPGEVLRSIDLPAAALRSRTAYRQIALSPLGRSGTLVIARLAEDGGFTVTVTGGTEHPELLTFTGIPTAAELETAVHGIDSWYTDAHGAPDWREAMTELLAEEARTELTNTALEAAS
ncbi:MAG: FAD binding domain-containing protein [Burkholderiaceae bacterium]|nr:FAD binding domain-containing protein [Microbacteriaceae bacterium]